MSDSCRTVPIMGTYVQENGIIRDAAGWVIGRLVDDVVFEAVAERETKRGLQYCAGIPTETLEAGAVVVPVPECRHPKATLSAVGLMLLQQARAQEAVMSYDAATALRWAAKAIEAALSRFQQSGGCSS